MVSYKVPSKFNPPRPSSIKEIIPTLPLPVVKTSYSLLIIFDVNFKTQVLSKFRKSKRFEEIYNLISILHNEELGNKEISDYLNFHNIKTPNGKDY